MTTPASGQISFQDLHDECRLGSMSDLDMSDADIASMLVDSTPGPELELFDFYDLTCVPTWPDEFDGVADTVLYAGSPTGTAQCVLSWNADGEIHLKTVEDGFVTDLYEQWHPRYSTSGLGTDYEIKYTRVSGYAISSGNFSSGHDVWHTFGAGRYLSLTDTSSASGGFQATFDISIRPVDNLAAHHTIVHRFDVTAIYDTAL